jgi:hypothetical protein
MYLHTINGAKLRGALMNLKKNAQFGIIFGDVP